MTPQKSSSGRINIERPEVREMAGRLAAIQGISITATVKEALRSALADVRTAGPKPEESASHVDS
jgi:hypothetical protein